MASTQPEKPSGLKQPGRREPPVLTPLLTRAEFLLTANWPPIWRPEEFGGWGGGGVCVGGGCVPKELPPFYELSPVPLSPPPGL